MVVGWGGGGEEPAYPDVFSGVPSLHPKTEIRLCPQAREEALPKRSYTGYVRYERVWF